MTSDIRIEPANVGDVPAILAFVRALADYEKLAHAVVATEDTIRETLFGPRPSAAVTMARLDGVPAGFAVWFHNYSTFLGRPGLYLEDLFVLPEHRGRGVGRALLTHLARVAVDLGCGRMEWSVLDWNEPAIGFYKSLGATPMEEWTTFRLTGDALRRLASRPQPPASSPQPPASSPQPPDPSP